MGKKKKRKVVGVLAGTRGPEFCVLFYSVNLVFLHVSKLNVGKVYNAAGRGFLDS